MFDTFFNALKRSGLMVGLVYFVVYMLISGFLYALLRTAFRNNSAISMAILFVLIFFCTSFLTGAQIRSFQNVLSGIPVTWQSFFKIGKEQWNAAAIRLFLIIVLPILIFYVLFEAVFVFVGFGNVMQLHQLIPKLTFPGLVATFVVFAWSLLLMTIYIFSLEKIQIKNFFLQNSLSISIYYLIAMIFSLIPWIGTLFSALMLSFYPLFALSLQKQHIHWFS